LKGVRSSARGGKVLTAGARLWASGNELAHASPVTSATGLAVRGPVPIPYKAESEYSQPGATGLTLRGSGAYSGTRQPTRASRRPSRRTGWSSPITVGYCWIGRCAELPGSLTQRSGPALVYNVCACVQLTACSLRPPAAGSQPRNTLTEPRPGAMAARQPATAGARGGLCAVAGSQPPSRVISQAVPPSARFAARASLRSNCSQAVDRSPSRVGSESAM
jgi:hypothetical protein